MLTIENSRSGDEMLRALAKYGYSRDIGAGVYDVHSPVVPPCAPKPFAFPPISQTRLCHTAIPLSNALLLC